MADNDIMERIIDLEQEIAALPSGSVSKKTIKDKVYYYHRVNPKSENYRETLCIATGEKRFDKVYVIRHGFDKAPELWRNNEWCYPYAYEDVDNNKLYVVYSKNKEDCELAITRLESIEEEV